MCQKPTEHLVASRRNEDSLDVPAAAPAEGVHVSDRVRRAAEEYAARTLRLALHRRTSVAAVPATRPGGPGRRSGAEWPRCGSCRRPG
ncbi:hypothetical protein [Streptomyces sp. NPDC059781]|uniref:hypothetical protein n=1 Tax=Streptomyces sp. NPDC059781 TaxID=3346943 RepID=UPI00365E6C8C